MIGNGKLWGIAPNDGFGHKCMFFSVFIGSTARKLLQTDHHHLHTLDASNGVTTITLSTCPTDIKEKSVNCKPFFDIRILVHAAQAPFEPTNLTHDALFAVVDKAIASLPE